LQGKSVADVVDTDGVFAAVKHRSLNVLATCKRPVEVRAESVPPDGLFVVDAASRN